MFSKKEFAVVNNLRFMSMKISCSAELSMKFSEVVGQIKSEIGITLSKISKSKTHTQVHIFRSQEEYQQNLKQEAHGPWLAHLSDIATADMQMLCNIFPILSLQLMKGSSLKQFLVLKKNIWA